MKRTNILLKAVFFLGLTILITVSAQKASAITYTVDTTSDNPNLNGCTSSITDCSLRGAINMANSNPYTDNTIVFSIPSACSRGGTCFIDNGCTEKGTCTITLTNGMLTVSPNLSGKKLTITNSGGASKLLISGNYQTGVFLNRGELTLNGVTVTKGKSPGYAGGITNESGGTLTLTNSVVNDNSSTGNSLTNAGGICNFGKLTVSNSTISNNSALYNGGGIASYGTQLRVGASTINGNSSGAFGGGIYVDAGEDPQSIGNSTISGNRAARGGGIYSVTNSYITPMSGTLSNLYIDSTTITDNTATLTTNGFNSGGMVAQFNSPDHSDKGYVDIFNSIVAGNHYAPAPDFFGYLGSGYNTSGRTLIGDATGAEVFRGGSYLMGTSASPINPLLAPLANNGGPTRTHALMTGSPAIDAGSCATVVTDQRGYPRVGNCDMGAFELQ